MPTYIFECEQGHRFEKVLPVSQYNDPQTCECGSTAQRKTVPTMLSPDIANWDSYVSPATGDLITSKKQRKEDMKRSGCVDYEPSLRDEFKRKERENELKLDKQLDQTVDSIFESMPSSKKEMLERELSTGVDLEYTRGISNG